MIGASRVRLRTILVGVCVIVVGGLAWWWSESSGGKPLAAIDSPPSLTRAQTDVDRAVHRFDAAGVPILHIADVGDVVHPAWVALYALQYAGMETYDETKGVARDRQKFRACVERLVDILRPNAVGDLVWDYAFDNTYNDVTIAAPWSSAFGQAVGIEALVASYRLDKRKDHLLLAEKAAEALLRPIHLGGLLFESGPDVWFEEVPVPRSNPPHILNGHMRALLAFRALALATGKEKYRTAMSRGLQSLHRWLPLYDTGYWFRYDLNPRKEGLWFRLTNPQGLPLFPLSVDAIILRDPSRDSERTLDIGSEADTAGLVRLEGGDWGGRETLDGRTVRRIRPVRPVPDHQSSSDQLVAPFTYFYLSLPSQWDDNLRTGQHELLVTYKDEAKGTVRVQMRGIAPGIAFRDLRGGDLPLTGSGEWRRVRIPLRTNDLGWWVGQVYAEKHAQYLEQLAQEDKALQVWVDVAKRYARRMDNRPEQAGHSRVAESADGSELLREKIVLAADHPENPLSAMRIPITAEIQSIAKAILHGAENLTPHEKIMRFIDSMKDFKVGEVSADPGRVMEARVGACGSFTNVVLALAWTQGIRGRYVNLHNYPPEDGHTVAEFFIDGQWRLYDPTYGLYYTDTPGEKRNPHVLSFAELRSGKGRAPGIVRVLTNSRRFRETQPLAQAFVGPLIYERAEPAGPVVQDQMVVYPLSLDMVSKPAIEQSDLGPKNQGAAYVGAAGICTAQNWTISSLQTDRNYDFVLDPERVGRDDAAVAQPFEVKGSVRNGGIILSGSSASYRPGVPLKPFRIRFRALADTVTLRVEPAYCGPQYRYLRVKRYSVTEGSNL